MLNAIIFDLDGVICFTDKYHYKAWKELADSLGIHFDKTINNGLRGISRLDSLNILLEKSSHRFSNEEKGKLAEQKNSIYKELLYQLSPADLSEEVKNTLSYFRSLGLRLAIGSSSKNAGFILERIGLGSYFDAVSDGNGLSHSKPHPEVFLKAAQMLNLPADQCLVVEDAIAGAEAARNASMLCACVGDAARMRAGDFQLQNISDLKAIYHHLQSGSQDIKKGPRM